MMTVQCVTMIRSLVPGPGILSLSIKCILEGMTRYTGLCIAHAD